MIRAIHRIWQMQPNVQVTGWFRVSMVVFAGLLGCRDSSQRSEQLLATRAGFHTKLVDRRTERLPVDPPPPELLLVHYASEHGGLAAYLSPDPGDGARHPAIVWMTGGDTNSIDGGVWRPAPAENDQSARQYREAGIIMMYPSLRGGNDNPGRKEGFFGEVVDVHAAARFLAKQPYVDPKQIYLGGHSTGGTLALLVAAAVSTDVFRAVFAFGPVDDVARYGVPNEFCPFDMTDPRELELRAPIRWIDTISIPTFVIEGTGGNLEPLLEMRRQSKNPLVRFIPLRGRSHFDYLASVNAYLASRIATTWSSAPVDLSLREIDQTFGR
jgi:dipeptidyl aminopeptidase/acylaminoacyl peptidase